MPTKSSKKNLSKPKIQDEELLSKEEERLIKDSLNVAKDLNKQVKQVQQAKTRLEQDVSKLSSRIESREQSAKKADYPHKVLLTLKEELIKEFTPLLKNLNNKSLKTDIFKEITMIVDIEVQKLSSELNSKQIRVKKDISSKFSELESKILQKLQSLDSIKQEIGNESKKQLFKDLSISIAEKTQTALKSLRESIVQILAQNTKEFEDFKSQVEKERSKQSNLKRQITLLKSQTEELFNKEDVDLSSFSSKIKKLEQDQNALASLLERFENDLYDKNNKKKENLEKKYGILLKEAQGELKDLRKHQEGQEQFFIDKFNSVVTSLNDFESKLVSMEAQDVREIEKRMLLKVNELQKRYDDGVNENFQKQVSLAKTEFLKSLQDIDKVRKDQDQSFTQYKNEVSVLIRNYVEELDRQINLLRKKEESFTKKRKELLDQVKDISQGQFVKLSKDTQRLQENVKEEVAKHLLATNKETIRLGTELKESQLRIHENIDSKFISSKGQFEKEFQEFLQLFDEELKKKESNFLTKLLAFEEERSQVVGELHTFKTEVGELTKNYLEQLDSEFENIKAQEASFESNKDEFIAHVDEFTKQRKLELECLAEGEREKIAGVLSSQQEIFAANEESFRDIFQEKVTTLHQTLAKRLDSIEKKFIEKNLTIINRRIDEEMKILTLREESIDSKAALLEEKLEQAETREGQFFADLESEQEQLKEKVEERLTSLEKQFNKRFLDYDTDFSTFKSVIIDEVEGLMREVNTAVTQKLNLVDKALTKTQFLASETSKRTEDFDSVNELIEHQLREVRDDISDLRVKFDIVTPNSSEIDMTDHVHLMSQYEEQLVSLIKSLKAQNVPDANIKKALLNKGHPRVYVSMLLLHYEDFVK